jgi:RNA polymerase sigma-70 factor (ECF subfamily)
VLISDGGGKVSAALRPISGADKAARFVAGIAAQGFALPGLRIEITVEVNGEPGIVAWVDGEPLIAISLGAVEGRVVQVLVVRNPDKLVGLSVGSAR